MLDLKLLDLWASEILQGNIAEKYKPFDGNLDEAVQVESTVNNDAFNLKLIAGLLKDVTNSEVPQENTVAIVRIPISYSLAIKMQSDKNLFLYETFNFVNKALGALTRKFGNLSDVFVEANRVGLPGAYFNYMQDRAAIEFRFFAIKKG